MFPATALIKARRRLTGRLPQVHCIFAGPLILLVLVLLEAAAPAALAEQRFVAGTGDLPLMPGLEEIAESSLVFDKPEGRIVEGVAIGTVLSAEVEAFYRVTLPELGWSAADDLRFLREGEVLTIRLHTDGDRVRVHYSIAPEAEQP